MDYSWPCAIVPTPATSVLDLYEKSSSFPSSWFSTDVASKVESVLQRREFEKDLAQINASPEYTVTTNNEANSISVSNNGVSTFYEKGEKVVINSDRTTKTVTPYPHTVSIINPEVHQWVKQLHDKFPEFLIFRTIPSFLATSKEDEQQTKWVSFEQFVLNNHSFFHLIAGRESDFIVLSDFGGFNSLNIKCSITSLVQKSQKGKSATCHKYHVLTFNENGLKAFRNFNQLKTLGL